jgi:hypothetical protein
MHTNIIKRHSKILILLFIYPLQTSSTKLNDDDEENRPGKESIQSKNRKKPISRGLMQDKEKEKEKLNSNEEGGERKQTRARKQVEYNTFVDRNELLDNETL